MNSINIAGIDKVELLRALWEGSSPARFFAMSGFPAPSFDNESAKEAVEKYIDYYDGRCIKSDISGDKVDPWLYNRDAGEGKFEKIVEKLKK
jgi:hypothetical protein